MLNVRIQPCPSMNHYFEVVFVFLTVIKVPFSFPGTNNINIYVSIKGIVISS